MKDKDYLTPSEMELFLKASKSTQNPQRDYLLSLLTYRHGLRVSELISIRLKHLDLNSGQLYVHRLKGSLSTTHPLKADELRLLKAYLRSRDSHSPYLFISSHSAPFSRFGINYLIKAIGLAAKLPFQVHPHMLRHSCGYYLANQGFDLRLIQDYLGHRQVQNTVRYTQVNPARFEGMWD